MRRPDKLAPLFADVKTIKGVGDVLAAGLARLTRARRADGATENSARIRDLVFHLPASLIDRRNSPPIAAAIDGTVATFEISVDSHQPPPRHKRNIPYRVHCHNETGRLLLSFFHAYPDYIKRQLPEATTRIVSGRVERFGHEVQLAHPDYIVAPDERWKIPKVEAVYPLTAGISNKQLLKMMAPALKSLPDLSEWCDADFIRQQGWKPWKAALLQAHKPESLPELEYGPARQRLAYDELLASQLALAIARRHLRKSAGVVIGKEGMLYDKVVAALAFDLTQGQQTVLAEIAGDMASGGRMMRLLQGDVGSGKTVVALLAMVQAVQAGKQAALMAPTEILARQHAAWFKTVLEPLDVRVMLLTGKVGTPKERESMRGEIAAGKVDMVIGTHALFSESVTFHDLAFVVVDEQHRFGVTQRMQLASKAQVPPHILLMTATPIPRTLTMTVFGDMDSSALTEKPAGRQPIDTRALPLERLLDVIEGLKRTIADGNKVYWICPLVEETEPEGEFNPKTDLAAAEGRFKQFRQLFGGRVALVHGRMKPDEREPVMRGFAGDEYDILVATTVVEVGVDVPSATVMVIEHAERFGLSQLHQLRGRVGRGAKKSSCILLYRHPAGEVAEQRLRIMRETEDGFHIAEEDMRLRGAGDVLGTRQSGLPDFHFADLVRDSELVKAARDDVKLILHKDAELTSERGMALRTLLYLFEYDYNIRYLKLG